MAICDETCNSKSSCKTNQINKLLEDTPQIINLCTENWYAILVLDYNTFNTTESLKTTPNSSNIYRLSMSSNKTNVSKKAN